MRRASDCVGGFEFHAQEPVEVEFLRGGSRTAYARLYFSLGFQGVTRKGRLIVSIGHFAGSPACFCTRLA
jgi:hypothetical protein